MIVVLVSATGAEAAHTLGEPQPVHVSPKDLFRIVVTGGVFSAVGDVGVTLTLVGGGATIVAPVEDVDPNTSVGVRVPDSLPGGQYAIKVQVSSTPNDPPDRTLWVRTRPFRFIAKAPEYLANQPSPANFKDVDFGDVNNDGFLDLFESNSQAGMDIDRLYLNQLGKVSPTTDFDDATSTHFENSVSGIPSSQRTYDADLVDLDLDGDLDLVRIDTKDEVPIRVFLNDGSGNFTDRTIARTGIGPALLPPLADIAAVLGSVNTAEVDTGDVDGVDRKGLPDLLLCNWAGTRNVLLLNRIPSLGRFVIANTDCSVTADAFCEVAGATNRGGAFGNFNGDDRLDIILPNINAGSGSGAASASHVVLINTGNNGSNVPQFTVHDDWVTGPAPAFGAPQVAGGGDLKVADLDGDGDDDVAVGSPYETKGRILWNDHGTRLVELEATRYPVPERGYDVSFADLDRDGDLEIIFARFGGSQEATLINHGGTDRNMLFELANRNELWFRESGSGIEAAGSALSNFQLSVSAGDYDLDGDLDLVTAGFSEVRVWTNDLFDQPGEDRDWVFVLDRTRSMISGGKDFFAPSKNVLIAFLAQRRSGDKAGLVTFDYTGTEPLNPSAPDDAAKAKVESQVGDKSVSDLQTDVGGLVIGSCSGNCTAIGWAIKTGKEVAETSPDPDREKVVVLLTDGRQNQAPHPDTIIPSLPSNVLLYTIALGSGTDDRMLSALATNGGKFYFAGRSTDYASVQSALREVDNDLEGHSTGKQPLLPLRRFLWTPGFTKAIARSPLLRGIKILDDVAGDPDDVIPVVREHHFVVDPADSQVRFTLSWQNPNDATRMVVTDPKGSTYPMPNDLHSRERHGDLFHVVEVLDPLSGVWRVTEHHAAGSGASKLTGMVSSQLRLEAQTEFPLAYVGEPLTVAATLSQAIAGVRGALQLTSPNKEQVVVEGQRVRESGFGFHLSRLATAGTYKVDVVVHGPPHRPFVRTWQSAVHVAQPTNDEPDLREAKLTLDRTALIADGSSTGTAVLEVARRDGDPLVGANVSFVARGGTLTGTVTDHGDGTYSQTVVAGTKAGSGVVRARVGLARLPNRAEFRLLPGPVDPERSRLDLLVGPLSLCTSQDGRFALQVVPQDSIGNPIPGASVKIEKSAGPALEWVGPVVAVGEGETYRREFAGPSEAGVYEFSAGVNGVPLAERALLQVFDADSPEGRALGCVAAASTETVEKTFAWWWLVTVLALLVVFLAFLLLRRKA